jgi:predicted lipase
MNHTYRGVTTSFVPTKVIYNKPNDIEGFIGYLPTDNSIYVSFRGTQSLDNWIVDFDALKMNYTTWPECAGCEVHAGFYKSVKSVELDVISEVSRLKALFPTYAVKTVGHSLGAALAHLTALSLLKNGFETSVLNFGQPRVGNKAFAAFS